MIDYFAISIEEAEGRIASAFGSFDLQDTGTERYLGHEEPEYWARTIYFGPGVQWWREDPERLKPKPWP